MCRGKAATFYEKALQGLDEDQWASLVKLYLCYCMRECDSAAPKYSKQHKLSVYLVYDISIFLDDLAHIDVMFSHTSKLGSN